MCVILEGHLIQINLAHMRQQLLSSMNQENDFLVHVNLKAATRICTVERNPINTGSVTNVLPGLRF